MNKYRIFLSINNQEQVMELPVNPPQLQVSESGNLSSFDIIGLGEVNAIQPMKLADLQFSSLFPAGPAPYVHVPPERLLQPKDYVEMLRGWMKRQRPIRFVLTSPSMRINLAMVIEKFTWSESSGSVGDIDYELGLKEYRFFHAHKMTKSANTDSTVTIQKAPPERPDERMIPSTYTLGPGESLWAVAKRFFNDESKAVEIQRLNGLRSDEFKDLEQGRKLRLR
ncbi:LysM peptidoglycan-binding domain-containing protein [Paenibacillus dendritiformis]|uniref:LysM peptidoglycan-binding domain-containing protein n=1 Tax=Paenibacillus dendritiformis TaxID=130049 RepID=UPI00364D1DFC